MVKILPFIGKFYNGRLEKGLVHTALCEEGGSFSIDPRKWSLLFNPSKKPSLVPFPSLLRHVFYIVLKKIKK